MTKIIDMYNQKREELIEKGICGASHTNAFVDDDVAFFIWGTKQVNKLANVMYSIKERKGEEALPLYYHQYLKITDATSVVEYYILRDHDGVIIKMELIK